MGLICSMTYIYNHILQFDSTRIRQLPSFVSSTVLVVSAKQTSRGDRPRWKALFGIYNGDIIESDVVRSSRGYRAFSPPHACGQIALKPFKPTFIISEPDEQQLLYTYEVEYIAIIKHRLYTSTVAQPHVCTYNSLNDRSSEESRPYL